MSTTEQPATSQPQIAGWLETADGRYAGYYFYEPPADPQAVLDEIRQREQSATPGPWLADVLTDAGNRPVVLLPDPADDDQADILFAADAPQATEDDAEFIAHAREDVPRLLRVAEALAQLCRDTDGNWLEPSSSLPAGEFQAALALLSGEATPGEEPAR